MLKAGNEYKLLRDLVAKAVVTGNTLSMIKTDQIGTSGFLKNRAPDAVGLMQCRRKRLCFHFDFCF